MSQRLVLLLSVLPLSACGHEVKLHPCTTVWPDADRDGFGEAEAEDCQSEIPGPTADQGGDCDDADPDVVVRVWFADADGDGFGDPAAWSTDCVAPVGFVAEPTDCDDTAPSVHPGASEVCDGVDNDCDGHVDVGAEDPALWWADRDGDGFGDPGTSHEACQAPAGHVQAGDPADCDDLEAAIHPDGEEVCDGQDNDCDGRVDRTDQDWCVATAERLLEGEVGAGTAMLLGRDLTGDGSPDLALSSLGHGGGGVAAGAVLVWSSVEDGAQASHVVYGTIRDAWFGWSLGAQDVDGDGVPDLLIGAMGDNSHPSWGGGLWAVSGPLATNQSVFQEDARMLGGSPGEGVGAALLTGHNLDAHTGADVVVGVRGLRPHGTPVGGAWLFEGGTFDADPSAVLAGPSANSQAGSALAAGPLIGDEEADLVVGLPTSAQAPGAVSVLAGPVDSATLSSGAAEVWLEGLEDADRFGHSLVVADLDGDGAAELVVGAPGADGGAGAVYVFWSGVLEGAAPSTWAAVVLEGTVPGGHFGYQLAAADVAGDARLELLVSAPYADLERGAEGLVAVFDAALLEEDRGSDEATLLIHGDAADGLAGFSMAGGDVDGDGQDDLVLGLPGAFARNGGAALFLGPLW